MDTLYGIVSRITYYDEAKGFGIVKIKLDYKEKDLIKFKSILFSNQVTVLSNFDRKPIIDEEFEFIGEFETSSYGIQFRAKTFKRRNEQSKEGIITYLSSDYFPGIGKVIATKIFETLGKDCIKKIVEDRSVLDSIDINDKLKTVLYDNLVINDQNERQLINLLNIGISMRIAIRIIKILGVKAFEVVNSNPYQLIDLVDGIGFVRADSIAQNMGIAKDSSLRLKALIIFVLENHIYSSGNTYIHLNQLYIDSRKISNTEFEILNIDNYRDLITELINDKKIIVDEYNNAYDVKIYMDEYDIAKKVYQFLKNTEKDYDFNLIEEAIKRAMELNKIDYSPKQIEAITKSLKEPITVITGGPGTGKSTIIKGIIDSYCNLFKNSELIKEKIILCAPTGRASKRLMEVTGHKSQTIHKLLGYDGGKFSVSGDDPLDAKLIIIDEFSMVDVSLAAILFKSLQPTTKVVIVGDSDQLPSVGPGNVLKDLIEGKEITTVKLQKIHRQASDSSIITLAHNINQGILPSDITSNLHDRTFISCVDTEVALKIEFSIEQAITSGFDLIKDIQVLIPTYKGEIGIDAINFHLQDRFNPSDDEITYLGRRFRVNDKVIQLNNRSDKQVMNGDIGYILTIEKEKDKLKGICVMFDIGSVSYDKDELEDLNLAYAISIHKSQGSEFPVVIMPLSFKYYIMLKRKLIYTAITRSKKSLVLIGNYEAIRRGIVELEVERNTKLKDRIIEVFANPNIITNPFVKFYNDEDGFKNEEKELENISPYDFM